MCLSALPTKQECFLQNHHLSDCLRTRVISQNLVIWFWEPLVMTFPFLITTPILVVSNSIFSKVKLPQPLNVVLLLEAIIAQHQLMLCIRPMMPAAKLQSYLSKCSKLWSTHNSGSLVSSFSSYAFWNRTCCTFTDKIFCSLPLQMRAVSMK